MSHNNIIGCNPVALPAKQNVAVSSHQPTLVVTRRVNGQNKSKQHNNDKLHETKDNDPHIPQEPLPVAAPSANESITENDTSFNMTSSSLQTQNVLATPAAAPNPGNFSNIREEKDRSGVMALLSLQNLVEGTTERLPPASSTVRTLTTSHGLSTQSIASTSYGQGKTEAKPLAKMTPSMDAIPPPSPPPNHTTTIGSTISTIHIAPKGQEMMAVPANQEKTSFQQSEPNGSYHQQKMNPIYPHPLAGFATPNHSSRKLPLQTNVNVRPSGSARNANDTAPPNPPNHAIPLPAHALVKSSRKQKTAQGLKKSNDPQDFWYWLNPGEATGEWDVLCGRGGESNNFIGNKKYRSIVNERKEEYRAIPLKQRKEKTAFVRHIVQHVNNCGGRFVDLHEQTGHYYVVSMERARKKTSQALRETKELKWLELEGNGQKSASSKSILCPFCLKNGHKTKIANACLRHHEWIAENSTKEAENAIGGSKLEASEDANAGEKRKRAEAVVVRNADPNHHPVAEFAVPSPPV
jgi:hypothetical protein